jgi:ABC-type polysaccharide/polyol phosphate export permease
VTVLANMVHFFLGLPILAAFLLYYRLMPAGSILWLPVVIAVQLILTLGFALILSALTVHFRDIRDILANVLTFWFFATPIIYWWRQAPPLGKNFLNLNPFTHLAVSYQELLFFRGPFGHLPYLLLLGVLSVLFFLFGYFVFDRLRDSFAEEV